MSCKFRIHGVPFSGWGRVLEHTSADGKTHFNARRTHRFEARCQPREYEQIRHHIQLRVVRIVFFFCGLCYLVRAPKPRFSERELVTNGPNTSEPSRNLFACIFTDVQFWVPVAVLIAGLLLLEWIL